MQNRKIVKLCTNLFICIVFIFTYFATSINNRNIRKDVEECTEPIDVVYTWVNGSDPLFIESLVQYTSINKIKSMNQRFSDKNEMKFSLRSLEVFAPWVRHVYIVTNGQIPQWLNLEYEKVTVISHNEIFPNPNDLPTFSSPAIEAHLHRIPGLSQRFIYFNDDIFLGKPVYLEDFINLSHGLEIHLAYPMPVCAPECPWLYVHDSQCDAVCNNSQCQFDGGDCVSNPLNPKTLKQHEDHEFDSLIDEFNKNAIFRNKIKNKRQHKESSSNNTDIDFYSLSLQHTNRLFNTHYGFKVRKVPAHVPLFMDKDIIERMQDRFAKEFVATSSHKVRSSDDMQFAFAYYHYVMESAVNFSPPEIFDKFDTDGSGTWSDREIRTILSKVNPLPLTFRMVKYFQFLIQNCSKHQSMPFPITISPYERYSDSNLPLVTKELILSCKPIQEILNAKFKTSPKYKFRILKDKNIWFKMISSNISHVVGHLDEIRSEPRKFVCLNDNLDPEEDNELVVAILYDLYMSLFPLASQFELSPDLANRFLHIDELNEWKKWRYYIKLSLCCCIGLLVFFVGCRKRCIKCILK